MITLALRTDKPEAEIYLYDGDKKLAELKWEAHRQLGTTIHNKIKEILSLQGKSFNDIGRVAVYRGPGSFTGLRIGVSVANALAYGLNIPVVSGVGEKWLEECLSSNVTEFIPVVIAYGSNPHITEQKK